MQNSDNHQETPRQPGENFSADEIHRALLKSFVFLTNVTSTINRIWVKSHGYIPYEHPFQFPVVERVYNRIKASRARVRGTLLTYEEFQDIEETTRQLRSQLDQMTNKLLIDYTGAPDDPSNASYNMESFPEHYDETVRILKLLDRYGNSLYEFDKNLVEHARRDLEQLEKRIGPIVGKKTENGFDETRQNFKAKMSEVNQLRDEHAADIDAAGSDAKRDQQADLWIKQSKEHMDGLNGFEHAGNRYYANAEMRRTLKKYTQDQQKVPHPR